MKLLRYLLSSTLCLIALAASTPAQAQVRGRFRARVGQQNQPGGRISQLDNARIAFITSRLTLTQDQAVKFWPVYNEFISKRRDIARNVRQVRLSTENISLTDAQLRDSFNQDFGLRQQQIALEKDYFERVQKVLSMRQIAQLYQAERDFTKEVLKRVAGPDAAAPAQD